MPPHPRHAGGTELCTCSACVAVQGWQDHWVQCVLPLAAATPAAPLSDGVPGYTVVVSASDMQVSISAAGGAAEVWDDGASRAKAVRAGSVPAKPAGAVIYTEPEPCTCGLHTGASFERRWQLHDASRMEVLARSVGATLAAARAAGCADADGALRVASLGDNSLAGLAALQDGGGDVTVVAVEDALLGAVHTGALAEAAGLDDALLVVDASELATEVGRTFTSQLADAVATALGDAELDTSLAAVVAEPHFARMATHPLWCALALHARMRALAPLCVPGARLMPAAATVYAQAVAFATLRANHGTVGTVAGWDHAAFDAVERVWHEPLYTYPLWQYAYDTLSPPVALATLDMGSALPAASFTARLPLAADGRAPNAVVLWVDYALLPDDPTAVLSTAPHAAPYARQHVQFLPPSWVRANPDHVTVTLRLFDAVVAATMHRAPPSALPAAPDASRGLLFDVQLA